jgi:hypothetical protein
MIPITTLSNLRGSTVSVQFIGPKNAPYTLTGELRMVVLNRIILDGLKSGRTHKIPLNKVISIHEITSTDNSPLFFQDGFTAASSRKKEESGI